MLPLIWSFIALVDNFRTKHSKRLCKACRHGGGSDLLVQAKRHKGKLPLLWLCYHLTGDDFAKIAKSLNFLSVFLLTYLGFDVIALAIILFSEYVDSILQYVVFFIFVVIDVKINNKNRFGCDGEFLWAYQGHNEKFVKEAEFSIKDVGGIRLDSYETLKLHNLGKTVVHGTTWKNLEEILDSGGLKKGRRTGVHTATKTGDARGDAGIRNADVKIIIDLNRLVEESPVWLSGNGVILCDEIPTKYFIGYASF